MLRRLWYRIFGWPCTNRPYGCLRTSSVRTLSAPGSHPYCHYCWDRALFTEAKYRAWGDTTQCDPPHACETHGRCWTHSCWESSSYPKE